MEEKMETYNYKRLAIGTDFRLVYLLPTTGAASEEIEIELKDCAFREFDGKYKALSYACGDTSQALRQPVLCEGKAIYIYPTLRSALSKLRQAEKVALWCDGLCIDQGRDDDALEERAEQVRRMFEVYTFAAEVVVDLGARISEHHESFIQVLHDVAALSTEHYRSHAPYTFEYADFDGDDIAQTKMAPDQMETLSDQQSTEDNHSIDAFISSLPSLVTQESTWSGLADLLKRPYFKRSWVIQEHALGRTVHFMLGNQHISGSILARGVNRLVNIQFACSTTMNKIYEMTVPLKPFPKYNNADKIFKTRHFRRVKQEDALWDNLRTLVYHTVTFDCFDRRDKIYSVLGLCMEQERRDPAVRIDYKEPYATHITNISRYLLEKGGAYVLYRSFGSINVDEDVPSWAIDFRRKATDDLSETVLEDGSCELFSAGCDLALPSKTPFQPSFELDFHAKRSRLLVRTVLLPPVASVSHGLSRYTEEPPGEIARLATWFKSLSAWCSEQFTRNEQNIEAILSTVTVDTFQELGRAHRASNYETSPELALIRKAFRAWFDALEMGKAPGLEIAEKAIPLATSLIYSYGRSLASSILTQTLHGPQKLLYLVPADARAGDIVAVVIGLPVPLLLRPVHGLDKEQVAFNIVGSAYAHAYMDGQALCDPHKPSSIMII